LAAEDVPVHRILGLVMRIAGTLHERNFYVSFINSGFWLHCGDWLTYFSYKRLEVNLFVFLKHQL
jgi:hypothetical protein